MSVGWPPVPPADPEFHFPFGLSVFFPAYNDARSLPSLVARTIDTLRRVADEYEVIVVNDGSTDDTPEVLEQLRRDYHPFLRVVIHDRNRGYGAALRSGFAAATKEFIFYTDGDGQYDPAELELLLRAMTPNTGLVNGYKTERQDPWNRVAIGWLYNRFARWLFRIQLRDMDCDFRLIRRSVLDLSKLQSTGGTICIELVRSLELRGSAVVEQPVHHYPRRYGRSQFFRMRSLVTTFLQLCVLFARLVVLPLLRRASGPLFLSTTVRTGPTRSRWRCLCLVYALCSIGVALLWQFSTVQKNYNGNWTALFCIGALYDLPRVPEFDHLYRFANSNGFDAQMYYVMAHDPLLQSGLAKHIDLPGLRCRRILVPLMAHVLALGKARSLVFGFVAVNLFFLFCGSWWTSRTAVLSGMHPAWGLAFLIVPAVPISLDRLTLDLVFVTLSVGVFYYWRTGELAKLVTLLALLSLTRETGLLVAAAFLLDFLIRHQWRDGFLVLASSLPFVAWSLYVGSLYPIEVAPWLPENPYAFTWGFLLHPSTYPFSAGINHAVRVFDLLALAALGLGFILSLRELGAGPLNPIKLTNVLFTALGAYLLSLDDWTHVYDYGRVLAPMAANLLLFGISSRRWWLLLPAILESLRVGVQLAPQLLHVLSLA